MDKDDPESSFLFANSKMFIKKKKQCVYVYVHIFIRKDGKREQDKRIIKTAYVSSEAMWNRCLIMILFQ